MKMCTPKIECTYNHHISSLCGLFQQKVFNLPKVCRKDTEVKTALKHLKCWICLEQFGSDQLLYLFKLKFTMYDLS